MSKKKRAILKAATLLFATKGFADTTMHEISDASGAAEGTIVYHFKSKEQMLLTILEEIKETIIKEYSDYIGHQKELNGLDMMDEVIRFYLYLAEKMEFQFLLLHRHFMFKFAEVNNKFRSNLEEIYNCLVDLFEQVIVHGQKDGSIADVNSHKTALMIFTLVDGLVRFKYYNMYDAGALLDQLLLSCRTLVKP